MKDSRREIRDNIKKMSYHEAIDYVKSFCLHEDEESAIILCDVKGRTVVAAAMAMHCSVESITRYKAMGYDRIYRDLSKNA